MRACPLSQQAPPNALFTTAQGCLTGAMLFSGALIDRYGAPRLASGVHLSWFHLANLFPARKQTVSSCVIAAFVLSGVIFHVYLFIVEAVRRRLGYRLQQLYGTRR